MKSHKDEFNQWIIENDKKVYTRLSEVTSAFSTDFISGQKCTFINSNLVKFPDHTIMGFCDRQNNIFTGEDTGRYIYLDYDCFWMPAKVDSIILDKNAYSDIPITSFANKILIADIVSVHKEISQLENLRIMDNFTGKTELLNTHNIDLAHQPQESIKKLLSGKKTELIDKSEISKLVSLSKTVKGWEISAVKQTFNTADSSVSI